MQVICDSRGFVRSYAFVGTLVDGTEVAAPENVELFAQQFFAFRLNDGKLVYDDKENEARLTEELKDDYRRRREVECFSIINRGQLWYENISAEQQLELRAWYQAWLDVTDTLVVPERPVWIM